MIRAVVWLIAGTILLAGCGPSVTTTPDGGVGGAYSLNNYSQGQAQLRMLDGVNALRRASGLGDVRLDSSLNAAAQTHSRDMAVQNRPWHFSSDGSSPVERAIRAGYPRTMLGENIAETYETELQTLAAWMQESATRDVIMNPVAEDMGFGYFQESNGKIWWTLVMGGGGPAAPLSPAPRANTAPPGGAPTVNATEWGAIPAG